jgi:hypothetical protein
MCADGGVIVILPYYYYVHSREQWEGRANPNGMSARFARIPMGLGRSVFTSANPPMGGLPVLRESQWEVCFYNASANPNQSQCTIAHLLYSVDLLY